MCPQPDFDVVVVGAGMSGMTAALLLAADGVRTGLLEAHMAPGGCAGFFRRKEMSFDVGATTFISFQPGGIGDRLFRRVGIGAPPLDRISEYRLVLPDRVVRIPGNPTLWARAWADAFPELGADGLPFFREVARHADAYWKTACRLPSLPFSGLKDVVRTANALTPSTLPSLQWLDSTFEQFLSRWPRALRLQPLRAAINMLLQDTTQTSLDRVPTPYALLGLTLMRHGLFRPIGGAEALWKCLLERFNGLGGDFRGRHEVGQIDRDRSGFTLRMRTRGGRTPRTVTCRKLICSMPVWNTAAMAPRLFRGKLRGFEPGPGELDSAFALYCAVDEDRIRDCCQHYQVLLDPQAPLDDGNNLLISLSPPGDRGYAAPGLRSVTISTHTDPHQWDAYSKEEREHVGRGIVDRFLSAADRAVPGLREGMSKSHFYPASPSTYARFTRRYRGMAGNRPLGLTNFGAFAVPSHYGDKDFQQIGDTTFPGAGTVACMVSGFNAYRNCMGYWLRA